MDSIVFLIVLVLAAIIVLPIVAIVRANSFARSLREEMAGMMDRIRDLERGLQKLATERHATHAEPTVQAASASPAPVTQATPAANVETPRPTPAPMEDAWTTLAVAPAPVQSAAALRPAAGASFLPALPQAVPTPAPAPTPTPQPPAPAAPRVALPWTARPAPAPQAPLFEPSADTTADKQARAERAFSLEERLGTNWLNKLGVVLLVLGVAFFLAWKLQTWGPAGKVLCGFAVSVTLLGGGVWLERKEMYRIFARAGIGGGWALMFFTTFAMHHIAAARVLESLVADLVLMLLVVAGMVAHSLRYRSQTVTGLAFMLGFATLLTSHLQASDGTVIFSLTGSAVLAVGLVVVTYVRHWAALEAVGVVAVYGSHFVWLTRVLPANHASFTEFWPSVILILLYWLIFRLAYVLRTPLDQNEENISSLAAVMNAGGVLALLKYQSAHPEWAWWALAALGTCEMALAFTVRARRRQAFVVLSTVGTVLLVAAVPFKFQGVSWPVLWLVEAQVLALCGLRMGEPVFRRLGLLAGLATGAVLAMRDVVPLILLRLDYPDPERHVSLTVALALAAVLYWVHGEVYPRRWPKILESEFEAGAMAVTSYLAAVAAATALWVALPDEWLPIGWLALFLVLAVLALRYRVLSLLLQGDLLSLAAAGVLIFHHVLPLASLRLSASDPSHHPVETAVLGLAAVAFWIRDELLPRLLPKFPQAESMTDSEANPNFATWQGFVLPAASCLGAAAAVAALWTALPEGWIVVGWLALAVLLGLLADRAKSSVLAFEADVLALAAAIGWFPWNLWNGDPGWWARKVPELASVALLYAGMVRKTAPEGLRVPGGGAYSWVASVLLAFAVSDLSPVLYVAVIWVALGVALFEVGRLTAKNVLCLQGFALAGLAFAVCLAFDIESGELTAAVSNPGFSFVNSHLLEVLVLAAAGYWLMERTMNMERTGKGDHVAGTLTDGLGTLAIAMWFAFRFPSAWVPVPNGAVWVTVIWAGMATALMAVGWMRRRRAFVVWAILLAVAVVIRGLFFDLADTTAVGFWQGPLFHVAVAASILLAALPFAFQLRKPAFWEGESIELPAEVVTTLRRSDQWFFFAPFGLMVAALALKLNSGSITIAWSVVGVAVFLFALAVGERSFRLAGLALLLLSVVKILLMDVWALSPPDRYMTLIVMGLALLAVSFLYTRFGTVIRRYL
jgi:Predicted membrane protein (DUF2339)